MSSSYRKRTDSGLRTAGLVVLAVAAAVPEGAAMAADAYYQPFVELRAESSSNPGLDPVEDKNSDIYGGIAELGVLIGIATPRSDTSIRPRLKLSEYADRDVEPVEAFFDIRSRFQSERGRFDFLGGYNRRDTYTAELPDAAFDPINTEGLATPDPTTPETGNNKAGETRERLQIRPTYSYQLTERTSIDAEVFYQVVRYSDEAVLNRVDYDYARANGFVAWALNPLSDIRAGVYVSKYDAKNFLNETDAYGGTVTYEQRWSETTGISMEVFYEQDDITYDPFRVTESVSGWGGNFGGYWKGEVSEWRVTAGRNYSPSGRGGKTLTDQIRLQYTRDLSERLEFKGAVRYVTDEPISQIIGGGRDYARVELSGTWKMSPTWFVRGGYTYTYQNRVIDPEAADDNKFFVSFGYRGLGRLRR